MFRKLEIIMATALITGLVGCSGNTGGDKVAVGRITGLNADSLALRVGTPVPDFEFQTAGEKQSLSNFQGQAVLLSFWKTGYPQSGAFLERVQKIYDAWSGKGLAVLTVNLGDSETAVRSFLTSHNFSFPVLMDGQSAFNGTGALPDGNGPVSLLIDGRGITRSVETGANGAGETIEKDIEKIALAPNAVLAVNRPPEFAPFADREATEGTTIEFNLSASDPDGDQLSYTSRNLPEGARLDSATGAFVWQAGPAGKYEIEFEVKDIELTAARSMIIVATRVNRAPEFNPIEGKKDWVEEFTPVEFKISATDPDGDTVTCKASNLPESATFDEKTGTFAWKASPAGKCQITFEVSDGQVTVSQTIDLEVFPIVSESGDSGESCNT